MVSTSLQKTTLRHSRIAMAGGALALLSVTWLYGARFLFTEMSSSGLGAALSTYALGYIPAAVIWSLGLVFSLIGLVLAVRRRVRALAPILAISLCGVIFAWAQWPTAGDVVKAAMHGDTARMNRYLWLGADVNRPRRTQGGFDPPDTGQEAETPLTAAIVYGQIEMVRFLLDRGADINQPDGDGRTPVIAAVLSGRPEILELLIDRGAILPPIDTPAGSKSLMNDLRWSRWTDMHPERLSRIVEILIRHGLDLEPVEIHDSAMKHWEPALARRLAEARQCRAHPVNPRTDLRNLIALGDDEAAVALLAAQTELLTAARWLSDRYRMFSHAARFNCPQVMTLLRDHLPPPVSVPGQTLSWPVGARALHKAAAAGNLEIVGMLLDWGVPVDCQMRDGGSGTALTRAVWDGHVDVALLLLERGADVNFGFEPNEGNDTPIFLAAQKGDMAMVEMLLRAGARVDIHGANGRTPLDCAANAGHMAVVKILLDHGAFVSQLSPSGYEVMYQIGLNSQEIDEVTRRAW